MEDVLQKTSYKTEAGNCFGEIGAISFQLFDRKERQRVAIQSRGRGIGRWW